MSTLMEMIDGLIHEADVAALPDWTGIPLGVPVFDYHHPDELDAAWRRWVEVNGNFNCIFLSRMWHRSHTVPHTELDSHSIDEYSIDLRCAAGAHGWRTAGDEPGRVCQCVGDITTQVICAVCSWHHIGTEDECIEAWHDHAFPGWRDLPILPAKLRGTMGGTTMTPKVEEWLQKNYPDELRVPGAPIRTTRGKYGTRHVLGYSPYGGYDLSVPEEA